MKSNRVMLMYATAYKKLGGEEKKLHTLDQTLEVIREGLPLEMMEKATDILGVSVKEFAPKLGVNIRSYQRKKKVPGSRLTPLQSEQTLKITDLVVKATGYFGDEHKALNWLNKPSRSFAGKAPIELLDTSTGIDSVMDRINALEHGMTA